jgi:hypothetical protein
VRLVAAWTVALLAVIGTGVGVEVAVGTRGGPVPQIGTVAGAVLLNGGPPRPGGGQACGGTVPPVHLCYGSGTLTFTSATQSRAVRVSGPFRIELAAGTYLVSGPCDGGVTVDVIAGQTVTVIRWCQIR